MRSLFGPLGATHALFSYISCDGGGLDNWVSIILVIVLVIDNLVEVVVPVVVVGAF